MAKTLANGRARRVGVAGPRGRQGMASGRNPSPCLSIERSARVDALANDTADDL